MFPYTHIYCTGRIVKDASPWLRYGSTFPDIPVTGRISWDVIKTGTEKFAAYTKEKYPFLEDFARGLLLHEEPNGIDRFVHGESGYAYLAGHKILSEVAKHFPDRSLIVAHSFIEFAVEISVVNAHPELLADMRSVITAVEQSKTQLAKPLSEVFGLTPTTAELAITEFNNEILAEKLERLNESKQSYTAMTNRYRQTNVSVEVVSRLLDLALDVVRPDWEPVLTRMIEHCRKELNMI